MRRIILSISIIMLVCIGCSRKYTWTPGDSGKNKFVASAVDVREANAQNARQQEAVGMPQAEAVDVPLVGMVLKATAFRMSGDYADNVAVTPGADGRLVYFPAPTDISNNSKPVSLGNGWWLNRQGIGANSVFTKYTFEEYSNLDKVPSSEELNAAIIPGARVVDFIQLPYAASDALNYLDEIREYLK